MGSRVCGLPLLQPVGSVVAAAGLQNAGSMVVVVHGLIAPWHVRSSRIRDWIHVSFIGRWSLYHWATREAPSPLHFNSGEKAVVSLTVLPLLVPVIKSYLSKERGWGMWFSEKSMSFSVRKTDDLMNSDSVTHQMDDPGQISWYLSLSFLNCIIGKLCISWRLLQGLEVIFQSTRHIAVTQ